MIQSETILDLFPSTAAADSAIVDHGCLTADRDRRHDLTVPCNGTPPGCLQTSRDPRQRNGQSNGDPLLFVTGGAFLGLGKAREAAPRAFAMAIGIEYSSQDPFGKRREVSSVIGYGATTGQRRSGQLQWASRPHCPSLVSSTL